MISVLLPAHNCAATISTAIQSILGQTYRDFELIVVENGSNDQTRAIVAGFADSDQRVRLLKRTRPSLVSALNAAFAESRGQYIARMDADDVSADTRLELQARFLDTHPTVGLVASQVSYDGDREQHQGYAAYVDWTNQLLSDEDIRRNCFVESPFAHPSVCFRRELIEKYGAWREGDFPEDYELWLRWLDAGVVMAKLPEQLLHWSDSADRLSRRDSRYCVENFYRTKARYLSRWLTRKFGPSPEILVLGAGRESRKRAEMLTPYGVRIAAWIDIDPQKCGQRVSGRPVLSENELPRPRDNFMVSYVGNRGAREKVRTFLQSSGFTEGRDFLMAA